MDIHIEVRWIGLDFVGNCFGNILAALAMSVGRRVQRNDYRASDARSPPMYMGSRWGSNIPHILELIAELVSPIRNRHLKPAATVGVTRVRDFLATCQIGVIGVSNLFNDAFATGQRNYRRSSNGCECNAIGRFHFLLLSQRAHGRGAPVLNQYRLVSFPK